jgi:outer membrane protein assembly factor BamB
LAVKDYFTFEDTANFDKNSETASATPLVFPWKGKDLIVAAGDNGRLYLLDSTVMGGPDHQKPLFETEVIGNSDEDYSGNGFREGFSTWNDTATGTRWVYASLWGAPASSAKFPLRNGDLSHGAIAAFKVVEQEGQATLSPAWISADIASPAAVVNSGGVVFALATGEPMDEAKEKGKPYKVAEVKKASGHATLYALDGETGKQLYSSAGLVTSPSFGSGLAVANGRVYFATSDNNVYAFGFSKMQPQLTDK